LKIFYASETLMGVMHGMVVDGWICSVKRKETKLSWQGGVGSIKVRLLSFHLKCKYDLSSGGGKVRSQKLREFNKP